MSITTKTTSRAAYYKAWRKKNPEKDEARKRSYWERKAAKVYGDNYEPPKDPGTLSEQAKEVKRVYYQNRRENRAK